MSQNSNPQAPENAGMALKIAAARLSAKATPLIIAAGLVQEYAGLVASMQAYQLELEREMAELKTKNEQYRKVNVPVLRTESVQEEAQPGASEGRGNADGPAGAGH